MKKKGFTLIELLVVIAIIAMLLAILMPALGKVKKMAQRLVCGTNLKGMANALNVYAFDYNDAFPVAGGKGINTWYGTNETAQAPFTVSGTPLPSGSTANSSNSGLPGVSSEGWADPGYDWTGDDNVSVAASLYMLIREADMGPKSFICKGSKEKAFKNDYTASRDYDITELWDFSLYPKIHQSYAYQIPYNVLGFNNPADGTSNPANAIMADKNPWADEELKGSGIIDGETYREKVSLIDFTKTDWQIDVGNSGVHEREGQNVLFGDGHVEFAKRPDVGSRYDNIYLPNGGSGTTEEKRRRGAKRYMINDAFARSATGSTLVNDSESRP